MTSYLARLDQDADEQIRNKVAVVQAIPDRPNKFWLKVIHKNGTTIY